MVTAAEAIMIAHRARQERARQLGQQATAPMFQLPAAAAAAAQMYQQGREQEAQMTALQAKADAEARKAQLARIQGMASMAAEAGDQEPYDKPRLTPLDTAPKYDIPESLRRPGDQEPFVMEKVEYDRVPGKSAMQSFDEAVSNAGIGFGGRGQISSEQARGIAADKIAQVNERRRKAELEQIKQDWAEESKVQSLEQQWQIALLHARSRIAASKELASLFNSAGGREEYRTYVDRFKRENKLMNQSIENNNKELKKLRDKVSVGEITNGEYKMASDSLESSNRDLANQISANEAIIRGAGQTTHSGVSPWLLSIAADEIDWDMQADTRTANGILKSLSPADKGKANTRVNSVLSDAGKETNLDNAARVILYLNSIGRLTD